MMENLELTDCLDMMENQELMVKFFLLHKLLMSLVLSVPSVLLDLQVLWEQKDLQDPEELLGSKLLLENPENLEWLELQDQQEDPEEKDLEDLRGNPEESLLSLDLQESPEYKDLKVSKDLKDPRVSMEIPVNLDPQVSQESKDCPESLERKELPVPLEDLEAPDPKENATAIPVFPLAINFDNFIFHLLFVQEIKVQIQRISLSSKNSSTQ